MLLHLRSRNLHLMSACTAHWSLTHHPAMVSLLTVQGARVCQECDAYSSVAYDITQAKLLTSQG
jgi:hypothetical protein